MGIQAEETASQGHRNMNPIPTAPGTGPALHATVVLVGGMDEELNKPMTSLLQGEAYFKEYTNQQFLLITSANLCFVRDYHSILSFFTSWRPEEVAWNTKNATQCCD